MRTPLSNRLQRGVSMVELMVAMTISLIGTIIIFQVFEASEGIKRTTSSGGDAQQNGAIALYSIERDLRNAGMGINDTGFAGCKIIGYDNTRVPTDFPVAPATFLMVPVRIMPGANAQSPDALVVMYASGTHAAASSATIATMAASTDPVRVQSVYGFRAGDLVLVREHVTPLPTTPKECSLMEVTSVNTVDSALVHAGGPYTLPWKSGAGVVARFNKPGGLGVVYKAKEGSVHLLGNLYDSSGSTLPVHTTYFIPKAPEANPNTLSTVSSFVVSPPSQIADNVVHMRALYAMDDGINNNTVPYSTTYAVGDGVIDRYVDAATAGTPDWKRVMAVRVVLVARSALPEIPSSGVRSAPCDTTTTPPTWSGSAWAGSPWNFNTRLDLSADDNWQCYRYKVFETTVTLRNWIWAASS
jgi:type IV pilus assembly protein PilW